MRWVGVAAKEGRAAEMAVVVRAAVGCRTGSGFVV